MPGERTNGRGEERPLVFINARVIDPSRNLDAPGTVIVADRRIAAAGPDAVPGVRRLLAANLGVPAAIDLAIEDGGACARSVVGTLGL